jgi:(4S)-4-hydroxy-5-phosphonooxypentane-2,3-dione isomerase
MQQTTENLFILAEYEVSDENLPKVLELIAQMQIETNKEKGCIYYRAHQKNEEPNKIVLYEIYKDEASVNAHRESNHFKEIALKQIVPLLSSRVVTKLNAIGSQE